MTPDCPPSFDLDAYLARVRYTGPREPSCAVLEALHLAHAEHIPFENLDILMGLPIRLDLESLQTKLVRDRRGGYCFEQNTLFAAALEALGFPVTRLAARVRFGATRPTPRTHMVLRVDAEGRSWLADVGFGGEGLLKPVPMAPGEVVEHFAWNYRVVDADGGWMLQSLHRGGWQDLYVFTAEPQQPVDYEVANHYISTHSSSPFIHTLTVQLPTPPARYLLRDREFMVLQGDESDRRVIRDADDLLHVLADVFTLVFPAGTRFRSPVFA